MLSVFTSMGIITSFPTWRKTHHAEESEGYFDFKQLNNYAQIDMSNSFVYVAFHNHSLILRTLLTKKLHLHRYPRT